MGRYFVVNTSDRGDYITGEIVPDVSLPEAPVRRPNEEKMHREGSLELIREDEYRIVTLTELLGDSASQRLLEAWLAGDDSAHDQAQTLLSGEDIQEDVRMLAEKGDVEARRLVERDAPLAEMVAYIHREADRTVGPRD